MVTSAPSIKQHAAGSSFLLPMYLLPKQKREALFTLYAACRLMDDAVDAASTPQAAEKAIIYWHEQIELVYSNNAPTHPLMQKLQRAAHHYNFPKPYIESLLEGLRMDVSGQMFCPPMAVLERYCYNVASVVGLLTLRIFGCQGGSAERFAVELGHALQLTNILRDVIEDAARGRLYIPQEWLNNAGISLAPHPPLNKEAIMQLQPVFKQMGEKAAQHYRAADEAMRSLAPSQIAPALAMRDVYSCYFRHLQATDWLPPLNAKISLSWITKLGLAARAMGYLVGYVSPVRLSN